MNLTQRKLIALLTPIVLILLAIAITHNIRDDRAFYLALFLAALIALCVESWLWGWESRLQHVRKILIPGVAIGGFLITAAIISRPYFESVHRHSSTLNIAAWFRDDCKVDESKWGAIPVVCTKEGLVRDTAREKAKEEEARKELDRMGFGPGPYSELRRKKSEAFGQSFGGFSDNSPKSKEKRRKLDKEIEELEKLVGEPEKARKERMGSGAFGDTYELWGFGTSNISTDHPPEGTTIKLREDPFGSDTVWYWLISILFLGFIEYRLFQGTKPQVLK